MRVIADTNVVVSAAFWTGAPFRLIEAAKSGHIALYTSPALLDELGDVLKRPRFAPLLQELRLTPNELIDAYSKLAHRIAPVPIPPIVKDDPDDDAVLACALAAHAHYIVTNDRHLLNLRSYRATQIVPPRDLLAVLH